ncbi:MAG: class I SAM-dependent methyltransferase [Roseiarcus sp.]|jgi:methyltransferase family protein
MTAIFDTIMHKLYGNNIWDGFSPQSTEENVQGWNGNHPSLSRLTSLPGSKIIVDVGVWKGQSTITMANAMKNNNVDGVIIAVDTFLGSPEHWSPDRNLFHRMNGLPNLYNIFMSNVYRAGLTKYIIPMAQTASTAAKIIRKYGIKPTVIHVDAAHEYREAIQDIEDYWEILDDGGYIIGDDYHVSWPGVVQAAGEFSARVRRPLTVEPPKFIIQKS